MDKRASNVTNVSPTCGDMSRAYLKPVGDDARLFICSLC